MAVPEPKAKYYVKLHSQEGVNGKRKKRAKRLKKLARFIAQNPKATQAQKAAHIGVSTESVRRYEKELMESQL